MSVLESLLAAGLGLLLLVVGIETVVLLRLKSHYDRFLRSSDKGLSGVLEGIQKTLSIHERKVADLHSDLNTQKQASLSHLQHLVVKRFNPFSNTGGDQSFILGLFDGEQNGVVITSLHSRENTRFYVKSVSHGEGDPYPLSDDEKHILKKGTK